MNIQTKMAAAALPATAAFDWRWTAAMCFGLVSGWFCRAAIPYMNRRPWSEIKREFIVSVMITGGSLWVTLYFARLTEADEVAVGMTAWAVSFGGLKALSLAYEYVLLPIKHAVGTSPEQEAGDKADEAQKMKAAAILAAREIEREKENRE